MPGKLNLPWWYLAGLLAANLTLLLPQASPWRVTGALLLIGLLPGWAWANYVLAGSSTLFRWNAAAALSYALTMVTTLLLHYLPGPIDIIEILVALNILALAPIILTLNRRGRPAGAWPGKVFASLAPPGTESGRSLRKRSPAFRTAIPLLFILALGLYLRATNLHYSEFQGDEALAMIAAAEALEGHEDALFLRSKGPGEVLAPMALWRLTGTITELIARLPFTVASLWAMVTIYLLGQEFAGPRGGWLAAGFFAFNGFMVAFGRIVQYQVIVVWLSALAFLMALRWQATRQYRFTLLAGLCLGAGFLAHYDAILVLPAIGWLLAPSSLTAGRARNRPQTSVSETLASHVSRPLPPGPANPDRRQIKSSITSGLLFLMAFLLMALPFYLPFTLDPQANRTGAYVGARIGQELRNNLPDFFHFNTFYSSAYYLIITGLLILGLLTWLLARANWYGHHAGWRRWLVPGLIVAGILITSARPTLLAGLKELPDLTILPFALMLLGAFFALSFPAPPNQLWRRPPQAKPPVVEPEPDPAESWPVHHNLQAKAWQALIAWLAVPFLGYNFVVALGLTHIYTIVPAWSLLAAFGWYYLFDRPDSLDAAPAQQAAAPGPGLDSHKGPPVRLSPATRRLSNSLLALLFILFTIFLWNAFIRHDVEYQQDYPAGNLSLFWTPYTEPPQAGFFGFAHRAGWKAIGQQIAGGLLTGDYNSNEEPDVTTWYTRGSPRACDLRPEFYFLADDLVDVVAIPEDLIRSDYTEIGRITLSNQKKMPIMQQLPGTLELDTLDAVGLARDFDRTATPAAFARSTRGSQPIQANFSNLVQLIGYDLDTRRAYPGGRLPVTLYWQALAPLPASYQVFTHLASESGPVAQADGVPVCWTYPTDAWRPGQIIADQHAISVPADVRSGQYPLEIGLYLPDTFERLDVLDSMGHPAGTSITLATVEIRTFALDSWPNEPGN